MLYFLLEERDGIMGKVAVVTDSNSGITQAQGTELGIFVLPMPFMIDEEQFFEDVNLTQEQFYEKLESGANVVTSQPSPEAVMNLWKEILTDYDEIVHIPMSSGLSGSCQSAMMMSEEFDGRVQGVNNQRISVKKCLHLGLLPLLRNSPPASIFYREAGVPSRLHGRAYHRWS